MVVPILLDAQGAAQGSPGSSECLPLTTYGLPVACNLRGEARQIELGQKRIVCAYAPANGHPTRLRDDRAATMAGSKRLPGGCSEGRESVTVSASDEHAPEPLE